MASKNTRGFNIMVIISFGLYVLSVYAFLKDPTFFKFTCCSLIMFLIGSNVGANIAHRNARKHADYFTKLAIEKTKDMAASFNETFKASNDLIVSQNAAITKLQIENEQLKKQLNGH